LADGISVRQQEEAAFDRSLPGSVRGCGPGRSRPGTRTTARRSRSFGKKKELKKATIAAAEHTFGSLANQLVEKKRKEGRAVVTLTKMNWIFGKVEADLSHRPIQEITTRDVVKDGVNSKPSWPWNDPVFIPNAVASRLDSLVVQVQIETDLGWGTVS